MKNPENTDNDKAGADTEAYGSVENVAELGQLLRRHRKQRDVTLETAAGLANLSIRFLSEIERGKETAEIGKVIKALQTLGLEVVIQPRGYLDTSARPAAAIADQKPAADNAG